MESGSEHINEVTYVEIREHTESRTALRRRTRSVGSLQRGRPERPARERRCRWMVPRSRRLHLRRHHIIVLSTWRKSRSPVLRGRLVLRCIVWVLGHSGQQRLLCWLYHYHTSRLMVLRGCVVYPLPMILKKQLGSSGPSAARSWDPVKQPREIRLRRYRHDEVSGCVHGSPGDAT